MAAVSLFVKSKKIDCNPLIVVFFSLVIFLYAFVVFVYLCPFSSLKYTCYFDLCIFDSITLLPSECNGCIRLHAWPHLRTCTTSVSSNHAA